MLEPDKEPPASPQHATEPLSSSAQAASYPTPIEMAYRPVGSVWRVGSRLAEVAAVRLTIFASFSPQHQT